MVVQTSRAKMRRVFFLSFFTSIFHPHSRLMIEKILNIETEDEARLLD